jgi:hypothetical protein
MTTQHSNALLTDELWENAKIKRIKDPNINSVLTNTGHGLYILGDDESCYSDLRMSHTRPFWGYTHPLTVQNKYSQLTQQIDPSSNFIVTSKEDLAIHLKKYQKVKYSGLNSSNLIDIKYVLVELYEDDFLVYGRSLISQTLKAMAESKSVWVRHIDTTLYTQNNYFLTDDENVFDGESYQILPIENVALINIKKLKSLDSSFFNSFLKYMDNVLQKKELGKFYYNQQIIDAFIKKNNLIATRQYNYIHCKNIKEVDIDNFKKNGLIIDKNNFINNELYLSIPVACTKNELLDTLERITLAIKE